MRLSLLLAVFLVLGCGSTPTTSDPVASLRAVAERGQRVGSYRDCTVSELDVDVRKTDSLVSPLAGTVSCKVSGVKVSDTPETRDFLMRFGYEYRDGRWALRSAEYRHLPQSGPWLVVSENISGTPIYWLRDDFTP